MVKTHKFNHLFWLFSFQIVHHENEMVAAIMPEICGMHLENGLNAISFYR